MLSPRLFPDQRPVVKRGLLPGLVLGLLLLMVAPLRADVLPLKLEEMVAVSDLIVTVRVEETKPWLDGKVLVTYARTNVLDTIKGKTDSATLDMTYLGGSAGPITMSVPQVPQLITGEEVVLFLSRPVDQLTAAEKSGLKSNSDLVNSYQIVGGMLGRFQLVDENGKLNKTRKGTDSLPGDLLITRGGLGRAQGSEKSATTTVSYQQFRSAISDLVEAEKIEKSTKGVGDRIVGIRGTFAVPEKSANAIVRNFDPLPPLAYLSAEELKQLKSNLKAQKDAADAAKAAAEQAKPADVNGQKAEEGKTK